MPDQTARKPCVWLCLLRPIAQSVRHKLLALVLAPLLLGVPTLLLIVWIWGTEGYSRLMVNKVSADLGTAHEFFNRVQADFSSHLGQFAQSHRLMAALDGGNRQQIQQVLARTIQEQGLDYLLLLTPHGDIISGLPNASPHASRRHWPVVQSAMAGEEKYGLQVFSPEDLAVLSPELQQRAFLPLRDTPMARPSQRTTEGRGLMMMAGIPIRDDAGAVLAIVEGGRLLNGNLDIIDRLHEVVYQGSSLPDDSEGTATLFLDDVRIVTSVRLSDGQRAQGTRVSQAVHDKVMGAGQPWMGQAQVVDRSFISGYLPLQDVSGQRVGMLYVGFLEAPLRNALVRALAGIFALFLLVSGMGCLALLYWARAIFLPLERMSHVIELVENKDESARVGPIPSQDELGRLATAFDRLLDSLASRREELRRWGTELDRKVSERTMELESANQTLKQAQQQLVMTEKLAALGELTAGVAHEINNPVAVLQGNLDLLREILGSDLNPVATEIRLMDEQISRIQIIVNKLLQFARPGDFAGYAEETDVGGAVSDCLLLTRHNLHRSGVTVRTHLQASRPIQMNRSELQQVLINLIVNALQAMPEGGTLTLESQEIAETDPLPVGLERFEGIRLTIRDTGHGIQSADLGRIFDPFFTTKKQKGTGLGLSISYAIIQRYGGWISVSSQPGQGTDFTLWLRRQAVVEVEVSPTAPAFSTQFIRHL